MTYLVVVTVARELQTLSENLNIDFSIRGRHGVDPADVGQNFLRLASLEGTTVVVAGTARVESEGSFDAQVEQGLVKGECVGAEIWSTFELDASALPFASGAITVGDDLHTGCNNGEVDAWAGAGVGKDVDRERGDDAGRVEREADEGRREEDDSQALGAVLRHGIEVPPVEGGRIDGENSRAIMPTVAGDEVVLDLRWARRQDGSVVVDIAKALLGCDRSKCGESKKDVFEAKERRHVVVKVQADT